MSGITPPKVFRTFFSNNDISFRESSYCHAISRCNGPHLPGYGTPGREAMSKYEKDTHEFDFQVEPISQHLDQDFDKSAYTAIKLRYVSKERFMPGSEDVVEEEVAERELYIEQKKEYGVDTSLLRPSLRDLFIRKSNTFNERVSLIDGSWGDHETANSMKIWFKKDPNYLVFRTEIEIDLPLEIVVRYLMDESFMASFDKKRKGLDILSHESPVCNLIRYCIDFSWPISDREMIIYRFTYMENPDEFRVLTFNAEDRQYPPSKGYVRVDLELQGYVVSKVGPHKTLLMNYSSLNPKVTAVPMFILRGKLKEGAMLSVHLKDGMEAAEKAKSSTAY